MKPHRIIGMLLCWSLGFAYVITGDPEAASSFLAATIVITALGE